jgi:nicotinamide-nucleotide amidase
MASRAAGRVPARHEHRVPYHRVRPAQQGHVRSGVGPVSGDCAARIARAAQARGVTVAAAESLTGGMIATELAASEGASTWFRGAVVAYSTEVKRKLLGVSADDVVSAEAAGEMAAGAKALLDADYVVAVTGAGGPRPQDGRSPGTVFVAVGGEDGTEVNEHRFSGGPGEICAATMQMALRALLAKLDAPE